MRKKNDYGVYFNAGLGNQLFQFSFAHLLFREQGDKANYLNDKYHRPDRPFELEFLLKDCTHLSKIVSEPSKFDFWYRKVVNRLFRVKLISLLSKVTSANFLGVEINPFADRYIRRNIFTPRIFMGYFQHWKLVEKAWDLYSFEIINYLSTSIILDDLSIDLDNYIVLHVRRGDLTNQLGSIGALSVPYYKNAIMKIKNYQDKKLIILTDDLTGANDVIIDLKPDIVFGPENLSPWQALKLMSLADSLICANSTLSWWGAYLAIKCNPKAECVIPEPWFRNWPQPVGDAFAYPLFLKNNSVFLENKKISSDFKYTS